MKRILSFILSLAIMLTMIAVPVTVISDEMVTTASAIETAEKPINTPRPTIRPTPTPTPKPVTVKLNISKYTINMGKKVTYQLTATLKNGTSQVTWSSSNTSVATVNQTGLITAKASGTAYIRATLANGNYSSCKITVKAPTVSIKSLKSQKAGQVEINIKASSSMKSFVINYRKSGSTKWKQVKLSLSGTTAKKFISKLSGGTTYEFRVQGKYNGSNGTSYSTVWSSVKTISVKATPAPTPTPTPIPAPINPVDFTVGNVVEYGMYEQDNNTSNGKEPIEWIVLDRQGNNALLISKYGLDAMAYNTSYASVTWERCTLRSWLNSTFKNTAFTVEEQQRILTTNVDNSSGQGYSVWFTSGGNDTQDKIFLLSYAEANQYFGIQKYGISGASDNVSSRVAPTTYAKVRGAITSNFRTSEGKGTGSWWLRSPGYNQYCATYVFIDGSFDYHSVSLSTTCVRPAFWINLGS